MPRELKPCGTRAAFLRHRRAGETPCEPCRAARNAADAERNKPYSKARQRAYDLLKAAHEPEWTPILATEQARIAQEGPLDTPDQRRKARSKARQRALRALSVRFSTEFQALLLQQRAKEGLINESSIEPEEAT